MFCVFLVIGVVVIKNPHVITTGGFRNLNLNLIL